MRHGPHQGAQKSTSTGSEEEISCSKVSGLASTIQGSSVWQTLQRGTPEGIARTRFLVAQLGQVMIVLSAAIYAVTVGASGSANRREPATSCSLSSVSARTWW